MDPFLLVILFMLVVAAGMLIFIVYVSFLGWKESRSNQKLLEKEREYRDYALWWSKQEGILADEMTRYNWDRARETRNSHSRVYS